MNLEDVIDPEYGLQQDEWSLSEPTFGRENQLTVIGWSGKQQTKKKYIVSCVVCRKDPELFGAGYFSIAKCNLEKGQIPCGCSKRLSIPQGKYDIYASRIAKEQGYLFRGFVDKRSVTSKIILHCAIHGDWQTGRLTTLKAGHGCPECKRTTLSGKRLSDGERISQFFETGYYVDGTVFVRSERVTKDYTRPYWFMTCPVCNETVESKSNHLLVGNYSCACRKHKQRHAYILVLKSHDIPVALKIGISSNFNKRIISQAAKQVAFDVEVFGVWEFPSVFSCKQAEQDSLTSVEVRGVISRNDYPDGYTETVLVNELSKIISIYENLGGIRLNFSEE